MLLTSGVEYCREGSKAGSQAHEEACARMICFYKVSLKEGLIVWLGVDVYVSPVWHPDDV